MIPGMLRAKVEYYESGKRLWNARARLEAAKLRHFTALREIRKLEDQAKKEKENA